MGILWVYLWAWCLFVYLWVRLFAYLWALSGVCTYTTCYMPVTLAYGYAVYFPVVMLVCLYVDMTLYLPNGVECVLKLYLLLGILAYSWMSTWGHFGVSTYGYVCCFFLLVCLCASLLTCQVSACDCWEDTVVCLGVSMCLCFPLVMLCDNMGVCVLCVCLRVWLRVSLWVCSCLLLVRMLCVSLWVCQCCYWWACRYVPLGTLGCPVLCV